MVQEQCIGLLRVFIDGNGEVLMFGRGKRKGPVELEEVLQQGEGTMEDMWDVDVSQDVVWETVCAWCLTEQGITPDPADSHGICAYHSAQVVQSYRERKARLYS